MREGGGIGTGRGRRDENIALQGYEEMSLDKTDYQEKKVLILGRGGGHNNYFGTYRIP